MYKYREEANEYQWSGGKDMGWKTKRYKPLGTIQATRIYCTIWGVQPIFLIVVNGEQTLDNCINSFKLLRYKMKQIYQITCFL